MQKINVLVKTRASKNEVIGFDNEKQVYILTVKSAPEKGAANLEVVKLLSRHFKMPARIISGFKSKKKLVQIG